MITPQLADLDLVAATEKPGRLTLVALAERPGVSRFFIVLEYEYFPPGTRLNDEFQMYVLKWPPDDPILWMVGILPLINIPEAWSAAADTGMRIADGVPTLTRHGATTVVGATRSGPLPLGSASRRFPADHRRVFTIENDPDSPVYLPHGDAFIRAEERRWCLEFFAKRHP